MSRTLSLFVMMFLGLTGLLGGQEPVVELGHTLLQRTIGPHETPGLGDLSLGEPGIQIFPRAFDEA